MFQCPILHMEMPNWETKKKNLLELSKLQSFSSKIASNHTNFGTVNTTFFHANENDGNDDEITLKTELANILEEEFEAFEETFQVNFTGIDLAWFQTEKENMYHGIHNHGYGTFSVVCYLDYNPKVHTPIYFLCPYNNLFTGEVDLYTPPHLNEGSIIFFPSSINHFTQPNQSKIDRNILAFNVNYEWRSKM